MPFKFTCINFLEACLFISSANFSFGFLEFLLQVCDSIFFFVKMDKKKKKTKKCGLWSEIRVQMWPLFHLLVPRKYSIGFCSGNSNVPLGNIGPLSEP